MKNKVNEYVITKDGKDCEDLMFDTVLGYSLVRQEVNELKKIFPKHKWDSRKIGTDYTSF